MVTIINRRIYMQYDSQWAIVPHANSVSSLLFFRNGKRAKTILILIERQIISRRISVLSFPIDTHAKTTVQGKREALSRNDPNSTQTPITKRVHVPVLLLRRPDVVRRIFNRQLLSPMTFVSKALLTAMRRRSFVKYFVAFHRVLPRYALRSTQRISSRSIAFHRVPIRSTAFHRASPHPSRSTARPVAFPRAI